MTEEEWVAGKEKIIRLQMEADVTKHNFKMQELEMERANAKLIHEQILERGRISRAEERKMFMEKKCLRN